MWRHRTLYLDKSTADHIVITDNTACKQCSRLIHKEVLDITDGNSELTDRTIPLSLKCLALIAHPLNGLKDME